MLSRLLLAAGLAAAALPAIATPQARNATDLWFDPAESGWGLNVIHQGATLFATLFVYGADGQPRWYVASGLTGGPAYAGSLNECAGPPPGAAFDPRSVSCRSVGAMTLLVRDDGATLDYTVDGVRVSKSVTRFSFRDTSLTGLHRAYIYKAAIGGAAEVRRELEQFRVEDLGSGRTSIATSSDSEVSCLYTGNHIQEGQIERVAGGYECGPGGSRSIEGTWSMRVDPTPSGFVGSFSGNGASAARIAAALAGAPKLEGTGWRNGMWFVPEESGWGLNVIEQGDAIFATLYVFDALGRPRWYVASNLAQSGTTSDGTAVNSGPLYEATGGARPGAPFDPARVTRRQVGAMSFQARGAGSATLNYTVDGVSVTKLLTNFAFSANDPSGSYVGQIADAAGGHDPAQIAISSAGGSFTMRIAGMYGGACDYSGSSHQRGAYLYASGTVQCPSGGSAKFELRDLATAADGFTARVELSDIAGFVQDGLRSFHVAGARTGG